MGLFSNLFKKEDNRMVIGAPMAGKCVDLKEVPDPTFGEGIMGKGIAVIPTDGKVYAPADGAIGTMFPTGHAFTMITRDAAEILIHVGLETVTLEGKPFTIHVRNGAEVKKGDLVLEADLKAIEEAGLNIITPMVVCNSMDYESVETLTGKDVVPGDEVIKIQE